MSTTCRALLAVVLVAFGVAACEQKVTVENLEKVKVGMTKGQVEVLLGKGEEQQSGGVGISGAGIAGGSSGSGGQVTYTWRKGNTELSVTYKDGKVVSTSHN